MVHHIPLDAIYAAEGEKREEEGTYLLSEYKPELACVISIYIPLARIYRLGHPAAKETWKCCFYISCNIPIWKCVAVALQKKMDIEEIFKVDVKENLAETAILQSFFLPVSHKDPSLLSDLKLKSQFCFF